MSWFKRSGNSRASSQQQQQQQQQQHQHQQQRTLNKSSSHQKCQIRLGSVVFVLISVYLLGILTVVGWRQQQPLVDNNNYNNPSKKATTTTRKQGSSSSSSSTWCHYEGHCPVGTTCVGDPSSPWGGICQAYRPNTRAELSPPPSKLHASMSDAEDQLFYQECVSSCQTELEWEEHFYYDVLIPKFYKPMRAIMPLQQNHQHQHRPHACVLVFERIRGKNEKLKTANRDDWLQARSDQHVIRVDPLIEDTNNNVTSSPDGVLWTALCYYPCQSDAECGGSGFFHCDKSRHVCERNDRYWTSKNPRNSSSTVLVTGANSGYFRGLVNFAASARYWAPTHKLVVYNLGMSEDQLKQVESWSNVIAVEWKDGIPYTPSHVHQLKVYAWKPLAINESVHKYQNMFWLDAGATFTGPIDGLEHYLQRTGIFLVKGQDESMYPRAHENTFKYFHLDKTDFFGGPHFAGGIQGHLFPSRYIDTIVKPNAACALLEECIAPPGASLGNHRFDQTTLSILAYGRYHKIPHHTEFLAASSSQLDPDLSRPNSMFMWTARQGCNFYADRERGENGGGGGVMDQDDHRSERKMQQDLHHHRLRDMLHHLPNFDRRDRRAERGVLQY